jgi:hypothetical protein
MRLPIGPYGRATSNGQTGAARSHLPVHRTAANVAKIPAIAPGKASTVRHSSMQDMWGQAAGGPNPVAGTSWWAHSDEAGRAVVWRPNLASDRALFWG